MSSIDAQSGRGSARTDDGRSLAQWFCYIVGPVLIIAGIAGFLVDSTFNTGEGIGGDELLGLEVNGWHNIVHLATGAFLLAMAPKRATARTGAIIFGAAYALVTVIGFIDGSDVLNFIPVNTADNVLHLALAALGLTAGLASDGTDRDAPARREGVEQTGTPTATSGRTRVGR